MNACWSHFALTALTAASYEECISFHAYRSET
jgi:hypothetical protein